VTDQAEASGQRGSVDPSSTGVREVDEAMAQLDGLDDAPLSEHHEQLQRAHAALRDALDSDRSAQPG
jgi:hypothetical protein